MKIDVVTVGRSDFGIYLPLLRELHEAAHDVRLLVSGAHLSHVHGHTVDWIDRRGIQGYVSVEMPLERDEPQAIVAGVGAGMAGFARAYAQRTPDLLVTLGDRYEMLAAAISAAPFHVPILHLYGGEVTRGSLDDSYRHALTKLAHLHVASTQTYARRVLQLGEEPWRIVVPGLLSVDALLSAAPKPLSSLGLPVAPPYLLVTCHPETALPERTREHVDAVLTALRDIDMSLVFTAPNADPGSEQVREALTAFMRDRKRSCLVESFGDDYGSAMLHAAAIVGNSSSGIMEAGVLKKAVVNVGERQHGRVRGPNVIDVPNDAVAIRAAIDRALSTDFQASLASATSPFGDGHAAQRIVRFIRRSPARERLLEKRFVDIALESDLPRE